MRRSHCWISKDGQSNKKCFVSSIPSFEMHIGFSIPKILLQFVEVQFTKTNPKLCKIRIILLGHEHQRLILEGGGILRANYVMS